eukprot:CAMPEP_0197725624 /NCGR_PEP_ID=MMETSP1434-20131217/8097_1 /TAXON_ID=265543 /ORGANISM="Minutocellus polymorphus, Strain CCMP3303" /LENGTH=449 /DNA_ID=CAMNT_0043311163 /DNA_START=13 /DNA_END=1362 /DNA_ORIENTATION=+
MFSLRLFLALLLASASLAPSAGSNTIGVLPPEHDDASGYSPDADFTKLIYRQYYHAAAHKNEDPISPDDRKKHKTFMADIRSRAAKPMGERKKLHLNQSNMDLKAHAMHLVPVVEVTEEDDIDQDGLQDAALEALHHAISHSIVLYDDKRDGGENGAEEMVLIIAAHPGATSAEVVNEKKKKKKKKKKKNFWDVFTSIPVLPPVLPVLTVFQVAAKYFHDTAEEAQAELKGLSIPTEQELRAEVAGCSVKELESHSKKPATAAFLSIFFDTMGIVMSIYAGYSFVKSLELNLVGNFEIFGHENVSWMWSSSMESVWTSVFKAFVSELRAGPTLDMAFAKLLFKFLYKIFYVIGARGFGTYFEVTLNEGGLTPAEISLMVTEFLITVAAFFFTGEVAAFFILLKIGINVAQLVIHANQFDDAGGFTALKNEWQKRQCGNNDPASDPAPDL